MRDWPPIHDPRVLEWMSLDHEAWRAALERRVSEFGSRPFDEAALAHALAYPWERPASSYVMRDGEVELLAGMEPDERRAVVAQFARGRYPLVAFGANGAPSRLEERFGEFAERADRDVLVQTGRLHGVDVAAQATPTAFGTMPGVLYASSGTAVRASVLWVTPVQLATLTMMELGYKLGRLDQARFELDEDERAVDGVFAYVSRIGALRLGGEPVALAAVPADGRSLRAMTQEELLAEVAALAFGPETGAAELVRMCLSDAPTVIREIAPLTWPDAVRLPDDHWTAYPVG